LNRQDAKAAKENKVQTEPLSLSCPYCGEPVELDIDESGGRRQSYVEVVRGPEGDWSATLRTGDE
jgi:hypothetical protein